MRPGHFCACGPIGEQTLAHLCNAFLCCLSFIGQCPTAQDGPLRQPVGEPMLACESQECLCSLLHCFSLSTEFMEPGSIAQGLS